VPSLNADDEDVPQVLDMTPRFFLCLPKCLQFVVLCFFVVVLSVITFPLMGPMIILTTLFPAPSTRQLLRDYEEKSDIVEGRVVERGPLTFKFLSSIENGFCITVEYSVGDGTFRKKFQVSKEQYDEFTMSSTLGLLVVSGKPKSAMLKTSAFLSDQHQARWKRILLGILVSLFAPVYLAAMYMNDSLFSWDAVRHGCVIGVISFVAAYVLLYCWWWDHVAKQNHVFLESAERVGGDDYEAMPLNNQDSLTAPLLSVVTGM